MADDNRCGHAGCLCSVSGDKEYCSKYCEDAEAVEVADIECECGHPSCELA